MKRFPKHFSNEIITYAKQGKTPTEIAKILNLKPVSVNRFMLKNNFRQPRPGVKNQKEIIKLFHKGLSSQEISDSIKVNKNTVSSILNKNKLYYNPRIHNENYFNIIDSPNKAYFLGFIAADGALVNNLNDSLVLTISIHKRDRIILEKFKEELQADHDIKLLKQRNYSMVRLAFANKTITKALLNLGITERKSLTLGNIITNVPDPYKPAFIIGYFDGDGSVHKHSLNGKTIQFRGTFDFLSGIKNYFDFGKLYFHKTWVLKESKHPKIKEFYKLYDSCDFYLPRKYEKFDECRTISSPYSSINRG